MAVRLEAQHLWDTSGTERQQVSVETRYTPLNGLLQSLLVILCVHPPGWSNPGGHQPKSFSESPHWSGGDDRQQCASGFAWGRGVVAVSVSIWAFLRVESSVAINIELEYSGTSFGSKTVSEVRPAELFRWWMDIRLRRPATSVRTPST